MGQKTGKEIVQKAKSDLNRDKKKLENKAEDVLERVVEKKKGRDVPWNPDQNFAAGIGSRCDYHYLLSVDRNSVV